jgi:general secretion pathway protein G
MLASGLIAFSRPYWDSPQLSLIPEVPEWIFMVSAPLTAGWVVVASIVAMLRWRTTTRRFRLFLVLNGLIVSALAAAVYSSHPDVVPNREAVLRANLTVLRNSIRVYTIDRGKPPDTLDDLIRMGYFKEIPADPITRRADTWVLVHSDNSVTAGIVDIHSGSQSIGSDGTRYRNW